MLKSFPWVALAGWIGLIGCGMGQPAIALEVDPEVEEEHPMMKLNSVAELSDVKPTDWAFEALKTLVDRYGIVVGYPDRQFRGDQPMSRSEFAAGLNAAMVHINEVLDSELAKYATKEDLEALRKLQEEFARELAAAKAEVGLATVPNGLARLRSQSFSATTKLGGEVLFAATGVSNSRRPGSRNTRTDSNVAFGNRIKLDFDTSFSGKDRLTTTLKTGNISPINRAAGTNMARLGFQGDQENEIELDELSYRFPIGKQARVRIMAKGGSLTDIARSLNPLLDGTADGAVSRLGQRNPIYRQGGGSGAGLTYKFNDSVALSVGYLVDDAEDPTVGFQAGASGTIAQLTLSPFDELDIGLTYIRSYNDVETGTGSRIANDPFRGRSQAIVSDAFGVQSAISLSRRALLTGWLGWTHATATDLPNNPKANIFNWAITLAFTDVGSEGSLLGFVVGQPPKALSNDFRVRGQPYTDPDTSWHLETFYQWRVVDNINLTFGLLVITNPEHDRTNDTIYVGVVRSTFTF